MSVSDGQNVNAAVTNPAFIKPDVDDFSISRLGMQRSTSPSGFFIQDIQRYANNIAQVIGLAYTGNFTAEADATGNTYGSTSTIVANGVTFKNALISLMNAFATAGHAHTGSGADGAQISLLSILNTATANSSTGTLNNVSTSGTNYIQFTGASPITVTGFANGANGKALYLANIGGSTLTINNNDSGSLAANRITTSTGAAIVIPNGSGALLIYDLGNSLWRVVSGGGFTSPLTTKGDILAFSTVNARFPVGADGNTILADSTQALGVKWAAPASAPTFLGELYNLGFSVTASGGVLTYAIKQSDGSTNPSVGSPVKLGIRSSTATAGAYNERSISAALSMTLASGTPLSILASQDQYVWSYIVDTDGAGTMGLALSTVRIDDSALQNTVAESASVTATNASPCVFTETAHNRLNNDAVQLTGTAPTGFSTGTTYYIVSKAANTYQLSASPGGTAINSSSTGSSIVVHTTSPRLVSSAAYSSAPVRLVGVFKFNLSTPGTWTAPSSVSIGPAIDPKLGAIVAAYKTGSSRTPGTSQIQYDTKVSDTIGAVYSGSAWSFIVPKPGQYGVRLVSLASAAGNGSLVINNNGTGVNPITSLAAGFANTVQAGAVSLNCAQNDILDARPDTTGSTFGATTANQIFIEYLGQ